MPYQRPRTPCGSRRERAEVQHLPTIDDGIGGQVEADNNGWRKFCEIWLMPVPLDERSREVVMGAQLTAQHGYHFDTRYRTDLTNAMRLIWRDKTLQIHSIADDEGRKRRLILYCGEVQA